MLKFHLVAISAVLLSANALQVPSPRLLQSKVAPSLSTKQHAHTMAAPFQEKAALPPLLSGVFKTDLSPGKIAEKLRGSRATSASLKVVIQTVVTAMLFCPFANGITKLCWPLHVTLLQRFGAFPAFFFTSFFEMSVIAGPMALLMMAAMGTATAPEHQHAADTFKKEKEALLFSKSLYTNTFSIVMGMPPLLFLLFYPSSAVMSTVAPAMPFWATTRAVCFFAGITEILYYYKHKLFHFTQHKNPILKWLNNVHKVHHSANHNHMMPIDASRMHWFESTTTMITLTLGPLLYRSHPALAMAYTAYVVLFAYVGHCSFFDLDQGAHTIHHERCNCNFGVFGIMDYLRGTSRAKAVDLLYRFTSLQRKMKKKLSFKEVSEMKASVSASIENRVFKPNQTILCPGEQGNSFFILEEGSCNAVVPNFADGTERVVKAYEEPGDYFGDHTLLHNQVRATAIKAGPFGATLAQIPGNQFAMLASTTTAFQATKYDGSVSKKNVLNVVRVQERTDLTPHTLQADEVPVTQNKKGGLLDTVDVGHHFGLIDDEKLQRYRAASEDYLKELNLLRNEPRNTATIVAGKFGVTVPTTSRRPFETIAVSKKKERLNVMRQVALEM